MTDTDQQQHHFLVVALIGLTFALGPIMLLLGGLDAWVRGVPAAIAFEILTYGWIFYMYRRRHELSTRSASLHFVGMMLAIGVITGWWYVNDPLPFLFIITAIPIAGLLLGTRGFLATAGIAGLGLVVLGFLHAYGNPEVFDNHHWASTVGSCMVVGTILGGASSRLNEAIRAVPDPVTIRDYRRERELENQLAIAERDRALGALARAVAHDFNNLLTPIMANAEIASMSVDDPEVQNDLSAIVLAGQEARNLVRTVLEFQRHDSPVEVLDLGETVQRILKLVQQGRPDGICYEQDITTGMAIEARSSDVQRIVLNLVTNAQKAIDKTGTVVVRVQPDVDDGSEPDVIRGECCMDCEYAVFEVSDDGKGMSDRQAQTMFDAFVTHSGGTGLGLATVEEIVCQLGGYIAVWTEEGAGSRFRVFIPRKDVDTKAA